MTDAPVGVLRSLLLIIMREVGARPRGHEASGSVRFPGVFR